MVGEKRDDGGENVSYIRKERSLELFKTKKKGANRHGLRLGAAGFMIIVFNIFSAFFIILDKFI